MAAPGFNSTNSTFTTNGGKIKSYENIIENCSEEVLEIYQNLEPFNFDDYKPSTNPNRVVKVNNIFGLVYLLVFKILKH